MRKVHRKPLGHQTREMGDGKRFEILGLKYKGNRGNLKACRNAVCGICLPKLEEDFVRVNKMKWDVRYNCAMLKNIQCWQKALRQTTAAYLVSLTLPSQALPHTHLAASEKENIWNIHPYNYVSFLADIRGFHYEVLCRGPKIQCRFLQERWTKLFLTYHTMHGQP